MKILNAGDTRELRQFGLGLAVLVPLFFYVLLPWWFTYPRHPWPWLLALPLALMALGWPPAILPLYRGWCFLARPLAWFNTRLLLGLVFFVMLLPLGLWLYWRGKLHFQTGFERNASTYLVMRDGFDPKSMEYPF